MEIQEQYLKHKPIFKRIAILEAVVSVTLLLTLILLFFLPCFRIEPYGAEFAELFGIDLGLNFSLYDEAVRLASHVSDLTSISLAVDLYFAYEIMAYLFVAFGLINAAAFFIQSLIILCTKPETYPLGEYNITKIKAMKLKRYRPRNLLDFTFFFRSVFHVFVFAGMLFEAVSIGCAIYAHNTVNILDMANNYIDYFIVTNGVAWGFWIVLIFLIADIGLAIGIAVLRNQIKVQIRKEDSEKTVPPANEDPFSSV